MNAGGPHALATYMQVLYELAATAIKERGVGMWLGKGCRARRVRGRAALSVQQGGGKERGLTARQPRTVGPLSMRPSPTRHAVCASEDDVYVGVRGSHHKLHARPRGGQHIVCVKCPVRIKRGVAGTSVHMYAARAGHYPSRFCGREAPGAGGKLHPMMGTLLLHLMGPEDLGGPFLIYTPRSSWGPRRPQEPQKYPDGPQLASRPPACHPRPCRR